jgi:hypothetical protein
LPDHCIEQRGTVFAGGDDEIFHCGC